MLIIINTLRSTKRVPRWPAYGLAALAVPLLLSDLAGATPPSLAPPPSPTTQPAGEAETQPAQANFLAGLSRSATLGGDLFGGRRLLSEAGLSLNLSETSEILGNVSGGTKRGFDYDGLTQMNLQLDTQRAFDLHGGTFNISALQVHGHNLSANNLATLQTASGIEAEDATRLWEAWYQQKFLDEDRLDIKIGLQSLDQEFMVSQNALMFVNTMFGWPMVPSADMPGGGPAYPMAAPGIRLRARPTDNLTFLVGVFNGSPSGESSGDSQAQNPAGTRFPLNGGTLVIAEVQYAYPSLGSMVSADENEPLARTYRLGVWYDTESFADLAYRTDGRSLADPGSNAMPAMHRGDYSIYAVADQMVWRSPEDDDKTASVFLRAMGTPDDDRNLVDFSMNAGFVLRDPLPRPLPNRDDDSFGIGMGFANVSDRAATLDRATGLFTGSPIPVRSSETFIEVTYQYQLTPWCQLQPDFQYVFNPGGGVANPDGSRVKDEAVLGLRVNIAF